MYDPSIGQESLTTVDVIGVLAGHVLFGIAATLFLDWSWVPLSHQQKSSGRSLKEIKRSWGWNNDAEHSIVEKQVFDETKQEEACKK